MRKHLAPHIVQTHHNRKGLLMTYKQAPHRVVPPKTLLNFGDRSYWARMSTGCALFIAQSWTAQMNDGIVVMQFINAEVKDSQGRSGRDFCLTFDSSPVIPIPDGRMLTVTGEDHTFYVALARGCSLYFEKRQQG